MTATRRPSLSRTAAALLGLSAAAAAAFTMATAPGWRFAPETEFGGWESFVEPVLGDNPTDDPLSTTGATLVQLEPGAIITGGGNLYHPFAAQRFEVRDEVDCDLQELWLQVSTWGSTLDAGTPRLELEDCAGAALLAPPPSTTVLASYPNPQGQGLNQELLFVWDLGALSIDAREYVLRFEALGANMSLDALLLDVRTDCVSPDGCNLGTAYCFGDGSGAICPCGNAGAPGAGCANGANPSGASIAASGSLSIAAADLTLSGTGLVPNQPGLVFQGVQATNGGTGLLFGDGLRCAGSGVVRVQTIVPDAQGNASTSVDVAARGGVAAGDTRYYQLWYRDPLGSPCGAGFNLTNGLELTWAN